MGEVSRGHKRWFGKWKENVGSANGPSGLAVGLFAGFIVTLKAGFGQRSRLLRLALCWWSLLLVFLFGLSILSGCLINTELIDLKGPRVSAPKYVVYRRTQ